MSVLEWLRACPAVPVDPQIEEDMRVLRTISRAEQAARLGVHGERLDRLIDFLMNREEERKRIVQLRGQISGLPTTVADWGYL